MSKRKAAEMQGVDWSQEPCPLCTRETLPDESRIQWIACETKDCGRWYHCHCVGVKPQMVSAYHCKDCELQGRGKTQLREERPKRASNHGVDYGALDAGVHINSLRHSYTSMIESRPFAKSMAKVLNSSILTKKYLDEHGFLEPIVLHEQEGLDMHIPADLTVDEVVRLVGPDTPLEVMDVPTQGEDKGWTLGKWSTYYNDPTPTRVRNVISLEVSDSDLGKSIRRPRIVRDLDVLDNFWPKRLLQQGQMPKVQTYCLMSLQNSYTDFHVDFAGTSVYYHIIQGAKTFLFIPPTPPNLKKYSDWCMSSNQSKTFLAEECKETFKVELKKGDTMMIPPGWIHAVHTPEKSLVIGGNFLHLHGMVKHMEIAALEDRTKVPGKFRFPQFERTLWYCAMGVLAQGLELCSYEKTGVEALAQHLTARLAESHDTSQRQHAEGISRDHLSGDPAIVIRMLYNLLAGTDPHKSLSIGALSTTDKATNLVADVPVARYQELCPESQISELDKEAITSNEGREYVQVSLALTLENDRNVITFLKTVPDRLTSPKVESTRQTPPSQDHSAEEDALHPTSVNAEGLQGPDGTSEDRQAQAAIEGQVVLEFMASQEGAVQQPGTIPNPELDKSSNGYHDNNYLPPIMALLPIINSPPQLHKSLSSHSATDKSATTCFRCKTRKKKCNKERPCNFCLEVGLGNSCVESHTYVAVPSSSIAQQQTPKRKLNQPNESEPSKTPVEGKKVKVAADKASPGQSQKKTRKPGHRCGRCAKDKKQCGRELPMCDRCQKKGLGVDDCIYPPTKSGDNLPDRDMPVPQGIMQAPQHLGMHEDSLKSHVPQLSVGQHGAKVPQDGVVVSPTNGLGTDQQAKQENSSHTIPLTPVDASSGKIQDGDTAPPTTT